MCYHLHHSSPPLAFVGTHNSCTKTVRPRINFSNNFLSLYVVVDILFIDYFSLYYRIKNLSVYDTKIKIFPFNVASFQDLKEPSTMRFILHNKEYNLKVWWRTLMIKYRLLSIWYQTKHHPHPPSWKWPLSYRGIYNRHNWNPENSENHAGSLWTMYGNTII